MTKRIAALDLGTNTFHLLIADVSDASFTRLVDEQKHVKLGEGGINEGRIADAAFDRGIEAMAHFASRISEMRADEVMAVGTSALRSAANGLEFIERVKKESGITVQIIDGEREAELIYYGARNAVKIDSSALIVDIGGGSVEFIFCDKDTILWKKSYPVGAARLMARFHHSDPISESDLLHLNTYLKVELDELREKVETFKPEVLIGTAGAFETFAALVVKKYDLASELLNNSSFVFDIRQLKEILKDILESSHSERAANPDILPVRVDMIVVASVLASYLLDELAIRRMELSSFALKEGLLFESIRR